MPPRKRQPRVPCQFLWRKGHWRAKAGAKRRQSKANGTDMTDHPRFSFSFLPGQKDSIFTEISRNFHFSVKPSGFIEIQKIPDNQFI
jgi:hypothetical protein